MTNEDKPLFRVGGVYRNQRGDVTRINSVQCAASGFFHGFFDGDTAVEVSVLNDDGTERWQDGWRRLSDGKYREADCPIYNLIPGELELRDGQWVAAEEKEEAQLDGAELIRRWAEKERARLQKERAERLLAASSNEAMVARDCTEAACLYAEQRQEAERVRATLSAPVSTALPPLRSLTLSTDLEPASHQVRAAFGSAELVR
jgi:hypothetical protein